MKQHRLAAALLAITALLPACGGADRATAPEAGAPLDAMLVSIVPRGGATAVDPASPIVVVFSHPMGRADIGTMGSGAEAHGMEMIVSLHEGTLAGPEVTGTTAWSADRTTLTFTPAAPLKGATTYTLFLGGRMTTADGRVVSQASCIAMGGQAAGGGMMGGAQGGMPGGMGGMGSGMMGPGVQHGDGAHGMTFTFTTAP